MSQATRLSKLGGLLYDVVRCCKHKQTAAKVLDCPEASRFIQLLTEENLSRLRLQAFHVFPRVSTCFHVFPRVSTCPLCEEQAEYCTLVVKSRSVQLPEHEQVSSRQFSV